MRLFFLGKESRNNIHLVANDLLPSDRTVKNEVHNLANDMKHGLKHAVLKAMKNNSLLISPDN